MQGVDVVSRVLVVDDEEDVRSLLKEYLEQELHRVEVSTANNGHEAIGVLKDEDFDLVISDYKMPVMDGLTFLHRAAELKPDVPRIMITAHPDLNIATKALNDAHIVHFFVKPIEPETVRDVVEATLHARRAKLNRDRAFKRSLELMQKRHGIQV